MTDRPAEDLTVLHEGKYFRFLRRGNWEYIAPQCFTGVVMLVALTDDGNLVLIEQFRTPMGRWVVEIPAGLVGDEAHLRDEALGDAARRELLEETGYEAANVELVTEGAPSAGSNTVILSFFLATGLTKVHDGGGVDDEEILVHEIPLADVRPWLEQQRTAGKVIDLKVYTALVLAAEHLAD